MVLILSIHGDITTDDVIDWLTYFKEPYYRLNDEDFLLYHSVSFFIDENNGSLSFEIINKQNNFRFYSSDITKVWLRKFGFFKNIESYNPILKKYGKNFIDQLEGEFYTTINLLYISLKDRKWLTHFSKIKLSKIPVLSLAKQCGLNIPKTICTNNLYHVKKSFCTNERLISKSVKDSSFIPFSGRMLSMYTETLPEKRDKLPEKFAFSLIQNKIEKLFELRIFYLDNKFYSMAIMSQKDSKTKDDFRKYNFEKPNRWLSYELPIEIKNRINRLMKKLELNTGSIDMIYDTNEKYIFLEINPTGQFGMISKTCNYPIEKDIAKFLISDK